MESNPGLIQARAILGGAMAGFVPAGAMMDYGGATAPTGWVLCDGTTYDAVTNPGLYLNLWTAIGIAYGGTGQASFKVPDCQGRVTVMKGAHADVSTLGNTENPAQANPNRSPLHTQSNNLSVGALSGTATGTQAFVGGGNVGAVQSGTGINVITGLTFATPAATVSISSGGSVNGTIGRITGATRPIDSPAFITVNTIIKL